MKPCPVCSKPVAQHYQGHREKVYCNRACQQKAYRKRHVIAIRVEMGNAYTEMQDTIIKHQGTHLQWQRDEVDQLQKRNAELETYITVLETDLAETKARLTVLTEGQAKKKAKV